MSDRALDVYLDNEILHADPIRLVQLLYHGAIEAVGKARKYLRDGDVRNRSRQITKAMEILNELTLTLNMERGGEIARNLLDLYDYTQRLLQRANLEQADAPLAEVERLLAVLSDAWDQCAPAAGRKLAGAPGRMAPESEVELVPFLAGEDAYSPLSLRA